MYLSGNPMMDYDEYYRTGKYARSDQIQQSAGEEQGEYRDGQRVTLLAMVSEVRRKNTKSGGTMAFVTLEDRYGSLTALVFPKVLEEFGNLLQENAVVEATGRLSFTEDKEPELVCDRFAPLGAGSGEGQPPRPAGRSGLYLKVDSEEDRHYKKAMQYLAVFDEGQYDVFFFFRDSGKLMKAPARYRTAVNPVLVSALERLLGEENVAFRK